jgi:2-dehydro-3-deoxyphosphogalactonate aldolase
VADDDRFDRHFAEMPLIAVLRGICPDEVEPVGRGLVAAGFRLLEVTMNSPEPIEGIRRLAAAVGGEASVGAGTVLDPAEVADVARVGGTFIVSPNMNPDVIKATRAAGLSSAPGVATPSEGFTALAAGASLLKVFPAEQVGPAVLKAWRAVFPRHVRLVPVGSITAESMKAFTAAGAAGFGLGSNLYKPGKTAAEVESAARDFVTAWRATRN